MSFRSNILSQRKVIIASEPNTFIGGVSSLFPDVQSLATGLNILVSDITFFEVVKTGIKCTINTSYNIPASFGNGSLTSFRESGNNILSLGTITNNTLLKSFETNSDFDDVGGKFSYEKIQQLVLNGLSSVTNSVFQGFAQTRLNFISLKNCLTYGTTTGESACFEAMNNYQWSLFCHPSLVTANSGLEEGDILRLRNVLKAEILYTNQSTPPGGITDLSVGTNYSIGFKMSFTPPSSVNGIKFYSVYVDGFFNSSGYEYPENVLAVNLQPSTNYDIEIRAFDMDGNDIWSNKTNATTLANIIIDTPSIIRYLKMEDDVADATGNSTPIQTALTFADGVVGRKAVFNGSTSRIQIPDSNDLTFSNGTTDNPFSIALIFSKDAPAPTADLGHLIDKYTEYQVYFYQNGVVFILRDATNGGYIRKSVNFNFTLGQSYLLTVTYNGSGIDKGINIYKEGINIRGTYPSGGNYVCMKNSGNVVNLGWQSGYKFIGTEDEVLFFNKELNYIEINEMKTKFNLSQHLI